MLLLGFLGAPIVLSSTVRVHEQILLAFFVVKDRSVGCVDQHVLVAFKRNRLEDAYSFVIPTLVKELQELASPLLDLYVHMVSVLLSQLMHSGLHVLQTDSQLGQSSQGPANNSIASLPFAVVLFKNSLVKVNYLIFIHNYRLVVGIFSLAVD